MSQLTAWGRGFVLGAIAGGVFWLMLFLGIAVLLEELRARR